MLSPTRADELRAIGIDAGLDRVGFTTAEPFDEARAVLDDRKAAGLHGGMQFTYRNPARSTDPRGALASVCTLVVGARAYPNEQSSGPDDFGPARIARYAAGNHYLELRKGLEAVGASLRSEGWEARVVLDDNALVDRAAAHRAGLGWYGKNANILLPGMGSWFVLGSVLTDAPLPPNDTPVGDGCGACTRCLDQCPTQAIVAPGVVDARRCLAWLVQDTGVFPHEFRVALGDRIYGCDTCQEVCPPNRKVAFGPVVDDTVPVLDLLDASDEQLLDRFGRWYIPGREPRYLRRNALVVLGNTAPVPAPHEVVLRLRRYLAHEDPLLRAHAVWAARRLGCDNLAEARHDDPSPDVQAELVAETTRAGRLGAVNHLLVTNDFPPKVGGIQSYLWELWRRLPAEATTVLAPAADDAAEWDAAQPFRMVRTREPFLVPTPDLIARIDRLAEEVDAGLILLDPAWPLGAIGPHLARPYGVVLHGAEVTIPASLPFVQLLLRHTMRHAHLVVAAGGYPADEGRRSAGRDIPIVMVPPGVDVARFHPFDASARAAARAEFGIEPDAQVVTCVSRLVPRKGVDVLLQAAARLAEDYPSLRVVVAGEGRDRTRLDALAKALGAPVQFLGAVPDDRLPAVYGCADIFAMLCRNRWLGLEQEGFGIVFLEAAAAGLPSIAGLSGGSAEAVVEGVTGFILEHAADVDAAEAALGALLDDPALCRRLGGYARARAEREFTYDGLAARLQHAMAETMAAEVADVADA